MKRQRIKSLRLNKRTVSTLKDLTKIKGGYTDWPETAKFCPVTSGDPVPLLTQEPGCDLHTIGWDDAWYCLSWQNPDAWCGGR